MKDTYLRTLGFVPLLPSYSVYPTSRYGEGAYIPPTDVRYRHAHAAQDGTTLFLYSWLYEPGYMLTTQENISSMADIVAELDSDDPAPVLAQVNAFFLRHGGMAQAAAPAVQAGTYSSTDEEFFRVAVILQEQAA
ncbi:hypothetical protein [Hymenobacter elongatus]|uniref:Uncharacterized protein n=1 Tax=Hymenobacter elongatus TaxID=877208 RepID=A0A4Z0PHD7_9BACT|nr:hypothetical protein [Hymenobacter elongatus]TGE14158.1 hypothetical protein E5J99_17135 [Hymenobacter elongatus]